MIIKNYQINQIDLKKNKLILFYGKNEGLKKQAIKTLNKNNIKVETYEEKEIFDQFNTFTENLLSKSLFEEEKLILIIRATDKTLKIIDTLNEKNISDVNVLINADNLEKKSKLRNTFEKDKNYICVAFYPDNEQTMSKITYNFLKEKNLSLSQSSINLIINKCNGDREILVNELTKIENYAKNGKIINNENINKLVNLVENYSINELIDNCLAKNKKKVINILNENNFTSEDCIQITRTFLIKSKRILHLSKEFEKNKNIELTISSARPPIFWKDKEIVKQHLNNWNEKKIKILIYKLGELELIIKKNFSNSVNFITDFILVQTASNVSNETL